MAQVHHSHTTERVVHVGTTASWQYHRTPQNTVVAICDELQLTLEADTLPELFAMIRDGMEALIEDLAETQYLDQYAKERKWSIQRIDADSSEGHFDLPLSLTWVGGHDFAQPLDR